MNVTKDFFNVSNPASYANLYTLAPLMVTVAIVAGILGYIIFFVSMCKCRPNKAKLNYILASNIISIFAIIISILNIFSILF